jgi:mRNA interferase RelE/StbE
MLDRAEAIRVVNRLERVLAAEGRRGEARSGEFAGLFKLRIGDLRVIYARADEGYLVLRIGHRRDVYRKGRPVFEHPPSRSASPGPVATGPSSLRYSPLRDFSLVLASGV